MDLDLDLESARLGAAIAGRLIAITNETPLDLHVLSERATELAAGRGRIRLITDNRFAWVEVLTPDTSRTGLRGLRLENQVVRTVDHVVPLARGPSLADCLDRLAERGLGAGASRLLENAASGFSPLAFGWRWVGDKTGVGALELLLSIEDNAAMATYLARRGVTKAQQALVDKIHPILAPREFRVSLRSRTRALEPTLGLHYSKVGVRKIVRLVSSLFPDDNHARVLGAIDGALGGSDAPELGVVVGPNEPVGLEFAYHAVIRP